LKAIETGIEGLVVLEPTVFGDARGFFMETYNERVFKDLGVPTHFVQDNHSRSAKGILRGLHLQDPNPQGKLVRVVNGAAWDVAVDLRVGSKTFGQWYGLELTADNKRMMYVPEGFGHGFCSLVDNTDFVYKCTALYAPADEGGIRWDDEELDIAWPIKGPLVSAKDAKLGSFSEFRRARGL